MIIKAKSDFYYNQGFRKVRAPRLKGELKIKLHNPTTGKTEVIEGHNAPTNALAQIFAGNYGGLLNYENFADIADTWLGGVLLFQNALDPTAPNDYGIPSRTSNPVIAHAGQTALSDQSDDLTRGNPDSSQTVKTANSVKHVWEWISSAGNGTISSLGLTHSDVGSYGCGVNSVVQKSLNPFFDIGCLSKSYAYGDNANYVMAVNGNLAYNFYLVDGTHVDIFKTPINNSKFKLQGGANEPLTSYTEKITAILPNDYVINSERGRNTCYYSFDFTNGNLILFGVPTRGGTTLYKDVISLTDGTVTHTSITVTGAQLWKFEGKSASYRYGLTLPTKAMILNNYLYVYGYTTNYWVANKLYAINLANTADIVEVDVSDFSTFETEQGSIIPNERFAVLGGLIVHDSFVINGNKTFELNKKSYSYADGVNYANTNGISSPIYRSANTQNCISACKLYLGTKYNLPSSVTKTSAQSMTVEYTLTEV